MEFNQSTYTNLGYSEREFAQITVADIDASYDPGELIGRSTRDWYADEATFREIGEEFEIMKTLTTIGYDSIVRAEQALGEELDFLRLAKEIALSHQENWDGSGYPEGLAGDAIPVSARLMAVADVYDALISRRVYKPPMPHDEAVELMRKGRGSHFDPDVLDAFLAIHCAFKQVADSYVDP